MPEATKILIADIFGYIVTVLCPISPHFKKKWQMLSVTLLANLLSGANFLLLGQFSAVGVTVVAITQAILNVTRSGGENRVTPKWELALFGVFYVVGGLIPFLVGGTLSEFGFLDAMPIFGALLLCCYMAQRQEQRMRLFLLANATVFTVYDILVRSTQVFAQLITIVSVIVALLRYRKGKKDGSAEETAGDSEKNDVT